MIELYNSEQPAEQRQNAEEIYYIFLTSFFRINNLYYYYWKIDFSKI